MGAEGRCREFFKGGGEVGGDFVFYMQFWRKLKTIMGVLPGRKLCGNRRGISEGAGGGAIGIFICIY